MIRPHDPATATVITSEHQGWACRIASMARLESSSSKPTSSKPGTYDMSAYNRTLTLSSAATLLGPSLLVLWAPQTVAESGNAQSQAEQGEEIAEQICTTCHRVPDEGGAPVGPEFSTLAERRDWTAQQLQQILNTEQHEEAVPASKLQLEAVASYLNQLQ